MMADGVTHGLSQMPPWGWALLLLGSGGAGTLSGLSLEHHEHCAEKEELLRAESELEAARSAVEAANATIRSLIEVIKQNQQSDGWIE